MSENTVTTDGTSNKDVGVKNNNVEKSPGSVNGSEKEKRRRSTSDIERRRRRQQKILGEAGNRLSKITFTYSSLGGDAPTSCGGVGGGGDHSTLTTSFTSRSSLQSSPTTENASDNSFSRSSRRYTGNFEAYNGGSGNNNHLPTFSVDSNNYNNYNSNNYDSHTRISDGISTGSDLHGSISKQLNSLLENEEPLSPRNNNNESYRNILENRQHQGRNSSTASLASSIGSEYPYSPQFPLSTDDTDIFLNQQLEQMPLPFPPFLNPDMKIFSLFGDSDSINNDINGGGGSNDDGDGNDRSSNSIQLLLQSRFWKLIHFASMIFLGIYFISSELSRLQGGWTRFYYLNYEKPEDILAINRIHSVPLFWYFITAELILQSTRLLLQKDQLFQGSTLGSLAANLPAPFPDVIKILMRYRLIWNSLWEDVCVLVFVIGFFITLSPMLSYFD